MQKIIPQSQELPTSGMNNLDSPKLLPANSYQLIENSFPGISGKPRNGLNEKKNDDTANGYLGNQSYFRPHAAHMQVGGNDYIFSIMRTRSDSYKDEYAIEVWDLYANTRSVLESFEMNTDLVFFGFQKLHNALYVIFDYGIKTNHTSQYRKRNLIVEWSGSAWTVRSMGIDVNPTLAAITSTDAATGIAKDLYVSIAFTFVRKTLNLEADTYAFEEPISESMESFSIRQSVKAIGTTYGQLNIPMSSNYANAVAQGATHCRIFRALGDASATVAAGLPLRYLVDIAITGAGFNPATVYHDTTLDSTLFGGETHYLDTAGYEVPPQGRYCTYLNGQFVIGGNPTKRGYWYASEIPLNTATPDKYAAMFKTYSKYITCEPYDGQQDTGCAILSGNLFLLKERKIFVLDNGDFNNTPRKISSTIGCACPQTLVEADISQLGGQCILFISESGPAAILSTGEVRLLKEFRIAEMWPENSGVLRTLDGVTTDWYSRNKVVSAFWNKTWYIAYGDSEDPETYFSGFSMTNLAGELIYDENGDLVLSQGSTFSMFGFKFASDENSLGGFKVTFPDQTINGDKFTIFEPQVLLSIDNLSLYAFSHKKTATDTHAYRLVKLFDPAKFQDVYLNEGAISYAMTHRTRNYYAGAYRWSDATVEQAFIYLKFKDVEGLTVLVYSDSTKRVSTFVFSTDPANAPKSYQHFIINDSIEAHTGSFFDVLVSKVVPVDGNVEFFGVELGLVNVNDKNPNEDYEYASSTLEDVVE